MGDTDAFGVMIQIKYRFGQNTDVDEVLNLVTSMQISNILSLV